MKRLFTIIIAFVAMVCLGVGTAGAQITSGMLAFPGADGYGKYTTGGRGGEVCYVTRLDDCSDSNLVPGTLRWAIRHDNGGKPRTVLFKVSGTIYLTSKLRFQYPDVSILGQSAPGGGICLSGYNMYISKDNVIVRYIRFRAGDIPNSSMTGLDIENVKNVILDHCSMTWSMEECLTAYDTKYTTVQWCILGEGLYNSKNAKGARAYATQWGGEHSSMHHSLITNSHSRSPRFNGARDAGSGHDTNVDSEFANNVVYNWSATGAIYGGEMKNGVAGYNRVYMINNFYRPGPSSKAGKAGTYFVSPSVDNNKGAGYGEFYLDGNKFEESGTFAPWTVAAAQAANADNKTAINGLPSANIMATVPYDLSGMEYESAENTFNAVTTKAGASLPRYDEVDRRLLDEAAGKIDPQFYASCGAAHKGIIDSPDDIKLTNHGTYLAAGAVYTNYPYLGMLDGDKYAKDSDGDGMPDAYEDAKGLNKSDATDGAADSGNGYTNLEIYLNGIADGTINKADYETELTPDIAGTEQTLPATVDGKTYTGYFINAVYYPAGTKVLVPEGITPTPVVTVAFDYESVSDILVLVGGSVKMPSAVKEGYEFKGWTDGIDTYEAGKTYTFDTCKKLTPQFSKQAIVEKVIYKTDFQDWKAAASSTEPASQTFTTAETNETLTFTYGETEVAPAGEKTDRFNYPPATVGYIMAAKSATPYVKTSALASVSTVSYIHCATGSNRGWGLKVKGDGDSDWVTISSAIANPASGQMVSVKVNRTNCELYFYNLNSEQNAYMTELTIKAMVQAEAEPEPEPKPEITEFGPFDAVVKNVEELTEALTKANGTDRYRIFLRNGKYDFGTKAKTAVKANVSLIGESQDGVLVFNNPGSVTNYQEQTPVLFIDQNQNNVYMQDLTIRQARDWEAKVSQGQALALRQRGKMAIYKNVTLQGVQDTYYLNKSDANAYFEDCTLAGEVDFIYGDGTVFFQNCTLQPLTSGACITASNAPASSKGIIFNECVIDGAKGYALGRPWNDSPAVTYLNTTMKSLPMAAGWRSMTSNLVLRFHEYGSKDAEGNNLDLSSRSISACNAAANSDNPVITAEQAATYAVDKVFTNWQPGSIAAQCVAAAPSLSGTTLSWDASAGAIGYAIVKNGDVIAFTTATSYTINDASATYAIRAINQMGGLGVASGTATAISAITTDSKSADTRMFNIAGQRVTAAHHGIVIQGGKKMVK